MFNFLWDLLGLDKLPYKVWVLRKSSKPSRAGGFLEAEFHYNTYKQIQGYWRHTLKDLAEYQGGP